MTIRNIILGVSDLETSIRFYRDEMGLTLTGRKEELAYFDTGAAVLTLSTELIHCTPAIAGATEVVFSVEGVREAFAELTARKVEFSTKPQPLTGSFWVAYIHDPDGHLLTIMGPERNVLSVQ